MQIFWEWNKLVSSIRGCHNRARCGLGAKVTDILSKDISGVAVEAGECVSPSESLFEGTQFEGPFLIGPPPPHHGLSHKAQMGICWAFPLWCMGRLSKL